MTVPQLMPWIGGATKFEAKFSALVCPIDESIASQIIESDAKVIDAAVKHAHAAFLEHRDATVAKRVEWLLAAADAIDKIEGELVRSLIRFIGKPRRAATFEAKRVGAFIRACAAQLPHLLGEVLPLDVAATGAGRFGFTTRIPYNVALQFAGKWSPTVQSTELNDAPYRMITGNGPVISQFEIMLTGIPNNGYVFSGTYSDVLTVTLAANT